MVRLIELIERTSSQLLVAFEESARLDPRCEDQQE